MAAAVKACGVIAGEVAGIGVIRCPYPAGHDGDHLRLASLAALLARPEPPWPRRVARWFRYRRHMSRLVRQRLRAGYAVTGDHETRIRVLARRAAGY